MRPRKLHWILFRPAKGSGNFTNESICTLISTDGKGRQAACFQKALSHQRLTQPRITVQEKPPWHLGSKRSVDLSVVDHGTDLL